MLRIITLLILASLGLGAQTDPFLGSFSGDQLALEVRRANDGSYHGHLVFGGQTFPFKAARSGPRLDGAFTSQGHSYQFVITPDVDGLQLVTEGTTYRVNRRGVSAAPAAATPAPQAARPTAGGKRHRHDTGFGMVTPAGWTVTHNADGSTMMPPGVPFDPNRSDNPEIYIVGMYNAVDHAGEQNLVQEMSSEFMKSGVSVIRAGERQPIGSNAALYYWELKASQYPVTVGLRIYVSHASGRTFVILAAGDAQRIGGRDAVVRDILASMDYQAPRMPEGGALADDTPLAQQWLQKLRGKVIKQFSGGGGMTAERTRFLAADGTYSMKSSSVISIDVGPYGQAPTASASSIGRNAQTGRWKIRDQEGKIFLQIWTSDGQMLMLRITNDARNWYLNGEKAFAVNP